MKKNIHPELKKIDVLCSCGNNIAIFSTQKEEKLSIEICDKCHPFFTGEKKLIDKQGRVEKFNQKYNSGKTNKNS